MARFGGRPLTILHVVAPGEVGGLESVVQALALGHSQRGHRVSVAAVFEPRSGEHPFPAALRSAGVRTTSLCLPARAYLRERRLIRDLCEAERPDVVHTHGYRPDVLHGAFSRGHGWRKVTTLHGSSRVGGSSTVHEVVQLLVLRRFDAVVAVSRPLVEWLRGTWVRRDRLHLIPNAWSGRLPLAERAEARRSLNLPTDGFVVAWVGRLIPVKGADLFLSSFSDLADLPVTASIVGEGPERTALETWTRRQGLAHRVRFYGTIPQAARYLRAFDVFVLSSRSEGTPVTLLEAMAAGVPVVATGVGGVPDVLTSEEAILVPPEDTRALAEAIRSVVQDPEAAARRAAAASRRLEASYGLEGWLDSYERVYDEITERRD